MSAVLHAQNLALVAPSCTEKPVFGVSHSDSRGRECADLGHRYRRLSPESMLLGAARASLKAEPLPGINHAWEKRKVIVFWRWNILEGQTLRNRICCK